MPEPIAPKAEEAKVEGPAETWVLPGSLKPLTTRLELDQRFGEENVRLDTSPDADGDGDSDGYSLIVFPDDPRKRLELVLDADNPDAPISELRVSATDSLWHDASGLRTGMTLTELVALNGAPISFYGLDWEYGGIVKDWHGGTLANAVGNPLFHQVRLYVRSGADATAMPAGDATFRSDDGQWPTIGKDLVVAEIGISWPSDDE